MTIWEKGHGFITSESGLFMPTSDEILSDAGKYFNLAPKIVEKYFFSSRAELKTVARCVVAELEDSNN